MKSGMPCALLMGENKKHLNMLLNMAVLLLPLRLIYKKGTSLKSKKVSRFPNIFFIKGTEEEVKTFAYDNVHLPFLRFYYAHVKHDGINIIKYPLVVPENRLNNYE